MPNQTVVEVRINEKPLSANKMHYRDGKRDTKEYREYRGNIRELLEGDYGIKPVDKLKLTLVVGYSSKLADLDNALKPLQDSMQGCMGFDDRQIFEIHAIKNHVKKGEEYIMLRLERMTNKQWNRRQEQMFPKFHTGDKE